MAQATEPSTGFAARQSWRRNLAELSILLAALVALFLLARGCLGCAAERAAMELPGSADAKIGSLAGEQMRTQYALAGKPSAEQVERVERVFGELRAQLEADEKKPLGALRVTVVVDDTVNAFALPGGEVFVLTGLLDRVGPGEEGDALLRGVLAHELGHAVLRHGMRNIARSAAFGIALAALFGEVDQLTGLLVAGATRLDGLSYSRDMETESDDFGAALLKRAGHSPEGLAKFLETLGSQPVPELLSTHPDPVARAQRIRDKME